MSKPYTAKQLLNDTLADLEEKAPRRKPHPKEATHPAINQSEPVMLPRTVYTGPSAESLERIAEVAGEMQKNADVLWIANRSADARALERWSARILNALGERETPLVDLLKDAVRIIEDADPECDGINCPRCEFVSRAREALRERGGA